MSTNPPPLDYGVVYHVYNRGVNREGIFHGPDNYRYFLDLYTLHVGWLVDTYAYCLLGNHFHFLLRVKDRAAVEGYAREARPDRSQKTCQVSPGGTSPEIHYDQPPSRHFSNLFNAYARAFNKRYNRTGGLFQRPFGRIPVTTDAYFGYLVVYIHQNPQKHGFVADYRDWPWSSYHALAGERPTRLDRALVLDWLGGQTGFEFAHRQDFMRRDDASGL